VVIEGEPPEGLILTAEPLIFVPQPEPPDPPFLFLGGKLPFNGRAQPPQLLSEILFLAFAPVSAAPPPPRLSLSSFAVDSIVSPQAYDVPLRFSLPARFYASFPGSLWCFRLSAFFDLWFSGLVICPWSYS